MVIKIQKKIGNRKKIQYKSYKFILTPEDIKKADKFDDSLMRSLKKLEQKIVSQKLISKNGKKKDPLLVWYLIGTQINKFLKKNKKYLSASDEDFFWEYLNGRSNILQKTNPEGKISKSRNDFKTASLLAKYLYSQLEKVGSWGLWREIITYRPITQDKRLLDWVINNLIDKPRTRDGARPLLKNVAKRFKRIETSILSDGELLKKLRDITNYV